METTKSYSFNMLILEAFIMNKEETMNLCSAKKRTLQSFVMTEADSAKICSPKKRTLQNFVVLDTINSLVPRWRLQTLYWKKGRL